MAFPTENSLDLRAYPTFFPKELSPALDEEALPSLYLAAQEGDVALVRKLISLGTDPNELTAQGFSPLYAAVHRGHEAVFEALVELGSDVEFVTPNQETMVFIAAMRGRERLLRRLIELGADYTQADMDGATPFYIAVRFGHPSIASFLASLNVDIHQPTYEGETPLAIAQILGSPEQIAMLIDLGAQTRPWYSSAVLNYLPVLRFTKECKNPESLEAFANNLPNNNSLNCIDLDDVAISTPALKIIANGLKTNRSVTHFMGTNLPDDEEAKATLVEIRSICRKNSLSLVNICKFSIFSRPNHQQNPVSSADCNASNLTNRTV
jgi:ankyrin repeat protein